MDGGGDRRPPGKDDPPGEGLFRRLTDALRVVLVRPRTPGNVGAVARVMKNLGLRRLALVADRDPRTAPEAFWIAHGAQDVLAAASIHPTLTEAVESVELLVGTTSRRGARWQDAVPPEELVDHLIAGWDWRSTALLFGPEDRGLSVDELAPCRWIVRVPTRPECPSMNLSHAVGLLLYTLVRRPFLSHNASDRLEAPPEDVARFFRAAESCLRRRDLLTPDGPQREAALRRLERLLVRSSPDPRDLKLLWALLRRLERGPPC